MVYCHRLNAEAGMKIQLSPIKPLTEVCKNVKQCYSSDFYFGKSVIFNFQKTLTLMCGRQLLIWPPIIPVILLVSMTFITPSPECRLDLVTGL